ncbi:MAG: hypothetical protein M3Y36_11180 [Actinomycetota bacterium]|nr:hypothetical protein [Actinomycetota bacterium]
MSHPVRLPDLFVDRSLGRLVVPDLLRAAGLRLTTLAERGAVEAHGVRCFYLARADLTGSAMAELYLDRMVDACADRSAGICVLSGRGMRRLQR